MLRRATVGRSGLRPAFLSERLQAYSSVPACFQAYAIVPRRNVFYLTALTRGCLLCKWQKVFVYCPCNRSAYRELPCNQSRMRLMALTRRTLLSLPIAVPLLNLAARAAAGRGDYFPFS